MENIDVLITENSIQKKVREVAKQIEKDYNGKNITVISILTGSIVFTSDLIRNIDNEIYLETMKVSSYVGETSGDLILKLDCQKSISGKDVIIIEDIIDSGKTLYYLVNYLKQHNPNSVKICTLLDKPSKRLCDINSDYNCFTIEDYFVVGYGIDYNEKYRNLPYIGKLQQDIK